MRTATAHPSSNRDEEDTIPLLSTVVPGRWQQQAALTVIVVSLAIFLGIANYAKSPLPQVLAFLPAYESAYIIVSLITAILVLGVFRVEHSTAVLVVAAAYFFDAAMALAHMLSFPRLFAPAGMLGAGPQTTAWLYFLWHAGFPLFVIAYALLRNSPRDRLPEHIRPSAAVASMIALPFVTAVGLTLLTTRGQDLLPVIMQGDLDAPLKGTVALVVWLLSILALVALWRRQPRSMLDLWLMVTVCVWLFNTLLTAVLNHGRFDVGWYAGRIYGLIAVSVLLAILLMENGGLYVQLVRARVDDRKRSTQQLSDSNARFSAIFNGIADAVVTIDAHGIIENINPAGERIFGYSADEIVGRNVSMLMPEPYANAHDGHIADYLRSGVSKIIGVGREVLARRRDGSSFPAWLTITEIAIPGRKTFAGVIRDLTAQRHAEKIASDRQVELAHLHRLYTAGELAAVIAHEINQPVSAIVNYGEASLLQLRCGPLDPDKLLGNIQGIILQAQRVGKVTRELRKFLIRDQEKLREPVDLNAVVKAVIELLTPQARANGVRLMFKSTETPITVLGVDVQLEHILVNLVHNAIQAIAASGQAEGTITLRIAEVGGIAHLIVEDDGPGFKGPAPERLFERFYTTKPNGLGMGLAICQALVGEYNGKIWAESGAKGGAAFHVTLPQQEG
jgi:PAS domain S-box-containing protein